MNGIYISSQLNPLLLQAINVKNNPHQKPKHILQSISLFSVELIDLIYSLGMLNMDPYLMIHIKPTDARISIYQDDSSLALMAASEIRRA